MAFTPPPQLPPRGARVAFSNAVDAFVKWLIALPAQLDAFLARLETIAAGGAYAIPYKWGVTVNGSSGFPAGGVLSASGSAGNSAGATASATTMLAADTKDISGASVAALLNSMVSGNTSAYKGHVRIVKLGDPSRWARYSMSAYIPSNPVSYTHLTLPTRG